MKIDYQDLKLKKKASSYFSKAGGELNAAKNLIEAGLVKEAFSHLVSAVNSLSKVIILSKINSNSRPEVIAKAIEKSFRSRKNYIPKTYRELLRRILKEEKQYGAKTFYVPTSELIKKYLALAEKFYKYTDKALVKISTMDIIKNMVLENKRLIKDISYDIYCPKTYIHHNRFTYWQPWFYISKITIEKFFFDFKMLLKKNKIKNSDNYVIGLNSRINQYKDDHYIFLDFDSLDSDIEIELRKIGGVLLKSGRGFHFIGHRIIQGKDNWVKVLTKISKGRIFKNRVDQNHIEVSLARGYSTLRITMSKCKPELPIFYKELNKLY